MRYTAKDRPTGGLLLYIYLYLCPVNFYSTYVLNSSVFKN